MTSRTEVRRGAAHDVAPVPTIRAEIVANAETEVTRAVRHSMMGTPGGASRPGGGEQE